MTADRSPPVPNPGRARSSTLPPPIPAEWTRLEPLYTIQTVLAQASGIEEACDRFLPVVTRVLQIRTAVLLDTRQELLRALMWGAAGLAPESLDEARDHARRALGYLAPDSAASAHVVSRSAVLPGGVSDPAIVPRHFVTLPLVLGGTVFGVFQLEGAQPFNERDLLFINVVTNQLAVALDRHHVQLALETSRAKAERANRRLRDLQAIAEAALEGVTLDATLAAVLGAMRSMFATEVASVLLVGQDGKTLSRRTSIGLADMEAAPVEIGRGAAGAIAAAGTAMYFEDVSELEDISPVLRANGIRTLFGAPLRARGRVTGVVYVASRDRRSFASDELQLLRLVAERIGTIVDNASLYEQALASVRARDAVMGIVSHDLRNPLNTIQLAMELLQSKNPDLGRSLPIIRRSVDVMTRLINDLRDVENVGAGRLSIATQPEDARSLVNEAVEGLREAAAKKGVRVEVEAPTVALVLECDRVRITQVLSNVLSNAVKFTPRGGSITISVAREPELARFSIADTGPGIREADRERVFDPYWQAKETAHLGSGLGLAISKGIVEAHHGTIAVESRVGHGTTFTFTVPLSRAPATTGERAQATEAAPADTGARVLVVDDEPNALSALAGLLEEEGFVVATAPDGLRALIELRRFNPDILLVDVELPGLKGPDLVRKAREELENLPVIMMSGHGPDVVAPVQQELQTQYLSKPIEIDALVAAIHRELAGSR